jgi:hypothetical protein
MTLASFPPAGSPHSTVRLLRKPLDSVPTLEDAYEVTGDSKLSDIRARIEAIVSTKITDTSLSKDLSDFISESIRLMSAQARKTIHFLKMKNAAFGYNITVLFQNSLPVTAFDKAAAPTLKYSHIYCFDDKVMKAQEGSYGSEISTWSFHLDGDKVRKSFLDREAGKQILSKKIGETILSQIQKTASLEIIEHVIAKYCKYFVKPMSATPHMSKFLASELYKMVQAAEEGSIYFQFHDNLFERGPHLSIFSSKDFPLAPFSIDPLDPLKATHEICFAKELTTVGSCPFSSDLKRLDFAMDAEKIILACPLLKEKLRVREPRIVGTSSSLDELKASITDLFREKLDLLKIESTATYLASQLIRIKQATPDKEVSYYLSLSTEAGWTFKINFLPDAYQPENDKAIDHFLPYSSEIPLELQGNFDDAVSHYKFLPNSAVRQFMFSIDAEKLIHCVLDAKRERETRVFELPEITGSLPKGAYIIKKTALISDIKYSLTRLISGLCVPEHVKPSLCYYLATQIIRLRTSLDQSKKLEDIHLYINNDLALGLSLVISFPEELRMMMVPFEEPKHLELRANYSYNFETDRRETLYKFGRFDKNCAMIFGLVPQLAEATEGTIPRRPSGQASEKRVRIS